MRQPIVIALPRNHPLASASAYRCRPWPTSRTSCSRASNGPRLFDAVLAACREAGFNMHIAHEVDNLYTACALVAAGLGVCLVPAGVQDRHSTSSMVLRPVTPTLPHVEMHIALAYKPQSCELVSLFVDVVREVVRKRSGAKADPTRSGLTRRAAGAAGHPRRRRPMRWTVLMGALLAVLFTASSGAQPRATTTIGDWPMYRHDLAGTGHSPLTQITPVNVAKLTQSWTYRIEGDTAAAAAPWDAAGRARS